MSARSAQHGREGRAWAHLPHPGDIAAGRLRPDALLEQLARARQVARARLQHAPGLQTAVNKGVGVEGQMSAGVKDKRESGVKDESEIRPPSSFSSHSIWHHSIWHNNSLNLSLLTSDAVCSLHTMHVVPSL